MEISRASVSTRRGAAMGYEWDFAAVFRQTDLLVAGGLRTLQLTFSAIALATPLGFVIALLRMWRKPIISWLAILYIDFFRTSALLVLLFWFYYAFPILIQLDLDAYWAAVLAIGLQFAAYLAEVIRGAIESISKGQREAAKAIGMSPFEAMRYVILPQAFRRMLPILFTSAIEITKATALAAAISFDELAYSASRIASDTYRPMETYLIIGAIYFVVIFMASKLVRRLEFRLATADRS
jgi:polar amino acid transport system permease protein